jgi:ATP-dependent phosphofructokinase / diphosphate-dependent phosphofructokinase
VPNIKKVGMLTGGGDCPGLNAVVRGIVTKLSKSGVACVGFMEGWKGLVDNVTIPLNETIVDPIVGEGGSILGSSRTNPFKGWTFEGELPDSVKKCIKSFKDNGLDALVAIGGDDTLEIAYYLYRDAGLKIVGCPKTIDNDVMGTDFTFGFMTAVESTTEFLDRLKTTARSHRRVIVMECMGRHAGWIAAYSGLAGGADFIAVPEKDCTIDEICEAVSSARKAGKEYSLVVVAEGAEIKGINDPETNKKKAEQVKVIEAALQDKNIPSPFKGEKRDAFGNIAIKMGELASSVADAIEKKTGLETRHCTPAHLQRGGSTCAYDRILGTRYGVRAAEAILKGEFGTIVILEGNSIKAIPMRGNLRETQKDKKLYKTLDLDFITLAQTFFG